MKKFTKVELWRTADAHDASGLLARVAAGAHAPVLRMWRPQPGVAFGRLDRLRPGFEAAADAAVAHGFEPLLRAPGGHAAAFHDGCLIVEEVMPAADAIAGTHARFADRGELFAQVLRSLGVDARVGEVPGEYCPGAYSVNARGKVKLAGTAQRVVRGGWLFGAVIVVQTAAPLRGVLEAVYAALELEWDPATAGAVEDEVPTVDVSAVEAATLAAFRERYELSA